MLAWIGLVVAIVAEVAATLALKSAGDGRALPVAVPGPATRTVLAGWDPDATWWLADVLPEPGEPTDWRRRED